MKLKSFGCSFIYGSDLSDQHPAGSQLTWPALIAQRLGLQYECFATPGAGNFRILCDIICQASLDDPSIFVINWTWIDRFDYVDHHEQWHTMRPSQDTYESKLYFRYFHSQIKDMLNSVYQINTAIDFLNQEQIPFLMSYMDQNIVEPIDPNWHDPRYLEIMQRKIKPYLHDFDGKNFLDWSRDNKFAVSDTWHPLEEAHSAAADRMISIIDAILRRA